MRVAVQETNVRGAEQAEKELLQQRALKLELELKLQADKNKLKEEPKLVDQKQVESERTAPTNHASSSTNGGKESDDSEYATVTVHWEQSNSVQYRKCPVTLSCWHISGSVLYNGL